MPRALLIIAALLSVATTAHPTVDICTPLTRETFNGPWEGLLFMGTHVTLFHLAIAADDHDSYLSEMDPDSLKGTVFRMDACTISEGKVKLHFTSLWPVADGRGWWFEGEGCSGARGVIWANFGTDLTERQSRPPTFFLSKGTWVHRLGDASTRAAEDISKVRSRKK